MRWWTGVMASVAVCADPVIVVVAVEACPVVVAGRVRVEWCRAAPVAVVVGSVVEPAARSAPPVP